MERKTSINDFRFELAGYGLYRVIYVSPATGGKWSTMINDMTLLFLLNSLMLNILKLKKCMNSILNNGRKRLSR